MTDNGLTLRTRYSQLPIAAVLAPNEIASALVIILTSVGHLRYRGEDPTSEERYPSQIRPKQFGRWSCKVSLCGTPSRIWPVQASSFKNSS